MMRDAFGGERRAAIVELALGRNVHEEVEWLRTAPEGSTLRDASRAIQNAPTPEAMQKLVATMEQAYSLEAPSEDRRAVLGTLALEAATPSEDEFVATF